MTVARLIAPTDIDPLYFDFTKWDGPSPALVRQHVETFSIAGIDGSGTRLVGVYGDAFTVRTQSVHSQWGSTDRDEFTAERAAYRCRELIGQLCGLTYEGVDYFTYYDHQYLVEEVTVDNIKRNVRLIGPDYDFPLGAVLTATWVLRPVFVGDGEGVPEPGAVGPNNPEIDPFGGWGVS